MKKTLTSFAVATFLGATIGLSSSMAAPVLQVAAPAGPGDTGAYADYQGSTSNPTETDTAVTNGSTILFAGVFQNPNVQSLGAANGGDDWSALDAAFAFDGGVWGTNPFDGNGAIVVAAVPDGSVDVNNTTTGLVGGKTLTLDIGTLVYATGTLSGLFPNNHDPLKDGISDFLFFDIGDFAEIEAILDYADETAGSQMGSVQQATISTSGLAWVHFDLMAIETSSLGQGRIAKSWENNPGSHDVTWKSSSSSSSTGGGTSSSEIPAPGTVSLLGIAMLSGLLVWRRRRTNS